MAGAEVDSKVSDGMTFAGGGVNVVCGWLDEVDELGEVGLGVGV